MTLVNIVRRWGDRLTKHPTIGIDLDERNLDLARERIGMWLQEGVA